jgi:ribosome-associated protein
MIQDGLSVKNGIVIPFHEFEITTSRAGGPGGQHVNKSDTRITVRWNVHKTVVLSEEQKARVLQNLQSRLTTDGDLIINCATSRSQQQNKEAAFIILAQVIRKALFVPKKRVATKVSRSSKESRLQSKARRGAIKKMRSQKVRDDY